MGKTIVNVNNYEELKTLSPNQRIKVNGVEAAVLFPGEGDTAIFISMDSRGRVVELTDDGFEVEYTLDGIKINSSWHYSGFFHMQKGLLKEMGAID